MLALAGCSSPLGKATLDRSDDTGNPRKPPDFQKRLTAGGYQKPYVVPPTDNDIEEQGAVERPSTAVYERPSESPALPSENQYHTGAIFRPAGQPSF